MIRPIIVPIIRPITKSMINPFGGGSAFIDGVLQCNGILGCNEIIPCGA